MSRRTSGQGAGWQPSWLLQYNLDTALSTSLLGTPNLMSWDDQRDFPKILGYPEFIHFDRMLHHKPSSYWGTHGPGNVWKQTRSMYVHFNFNGTWDDQCTFPIISPWFIVQHMRTNDVPLTRTCCRDGAG